MSIAYANWPLLCLATIVIFFTVTVSISVSDLTEELRYWQSHSKSGVIHLDDRSLSKFLTSTKSPRPYTLLIFFDAVQLHDKRELRLRDLRHEFGFLADSFISNHENDTDANLFFCDIEFRQSQASFHLFGVNSLPHIRLVGPTVRSFKDESEQMEPGDLSRMAESMAYFVESRTKFKVGPIKRPPILSKAQLSLILGLILVWASFAAKRVAAGGTFLHDRQTWLAGAIFVYFFSVSGSMHTIIRSMPMFVLDSNEPRRVMFFYPEASVQLGAEGFTVGFLFMIVGLLLAFMTQLLVYMKNVKAKRFFMVLSLLVCFWAVKQVIWLDNWKTGYGVHAYWPSGW